MRKPQSYLFVKDLHPLTPSNRLLQTAFSNPPETRFEQPGTRKCTSRYIPSRENRHNQHEGYPESRPYRKAGKTVRRESCEESFCLHGCFFFWKEGRRSRQQQDCRQTATNSGYPEACSPVAAQPEEPHPATRRVLLSRRNRRARASVQDGSKHPARVKATKVGNRKHGAPDFLRAGHEGSRWQGIKACGASDGSNGIETRGSAHSASALFLQVPQPQAVFDTVTRKSQRAAHRRRRPAALQAAQCFAPRLQKV